MGLARAGVVFAGVLLLASLVLILFGQAGLQAKCKDINDDMISRFNAEATQQASAAVPSNETSLAANVTEAVTNATSQTFNRFFQIASRSSSFVTCARIYSMNWWTWVMQILQFIWLVVAITGERWSANASSFLLFAATMAVLCTIISTNALGMRSYSPMSQTQWASVTLAGFIISTAAQYIIILCGPALDRQVSAAHAAKANPMSSDLQI